MEVRRAGDLDGDGRVDLLGYARAMMISPRTLVAPRDSDARLSAPRHRLRASSTLGRPPE
jgi:hypothetical protein